MSNVDSAYNSLMGEAIKRKLEDKTGRKMEIIFTDYVDPMSQGYCFSARWKHNGKLQGLSTKISKEAFLQMKDPFVLINFMSDRILIGFCEFNDHEILSQEQYLRCTCGKKLWEPWEAPIDARMGNL